MLVSGWTNPFEKYARQNGIIFPNFGVNRINIWNHHVINQQIQQLNTPQILISPENPKR